MVTQIIKQESTGLCITRKPGERVAILLGGQVVEVHVNKVTEGRVMLYFKAPPQVEIIRTELLKPMSQAG